MRLPRNHGVTDPELIRNAKSVRRENKCDFPLNSHARIVRDSATYRMLKYGPVPIGDHSYLIEDGKLTKYARWLMIAADLGMSFHTLAMLTRVTDMHMETRGAIDVPREALRTAFTSQYREEEGVKSLKILTSRGYISHAGTGNMRIHDAPILEFLDRIGEDYYSLGRFIREKIMRQDYAEERKRTQVERFHRDMICQERNAAQTSAGEKT